MHADPFRVENSAQGSSCQLKFVHDTAENFAMKKNLTPFDLFQ
jgi:hypothetical protein